MSSMASDGTCFFVVQQKGDTTLSSVSTVPTPTTKEGTSLASGFSVASVEPAIRIFVQFPPNLLDKYFADLLVLDQAHTQITHNSMF